MINHLKHSEIDKKQWDKTIKNSAAPMIYAKSWYLDIVSPGWEALVLDDYDAVMPLTVKKKYFLTFFLQPLFTQQLGIFTEKNPSYPILMEFINAVPKKYFKTDIYLNYSNKDITMEDDIRKRNNYILSLDKPFEELFKKYNDNHKRNIKKAGKNKLTIKNNADVSELIKLFKTEQGAKIAVLNNHQYDVLEKIINYSRTHLNTDVLGVYSKNNKLIAGAVFINEGDRIYYLFGTSAEEARNTGAMQMLMNHYIKLNAESDFILDFEGSNIPGIAKFFKGFGAENQAYYHYKKWKLF